MRAMSRPITGAAVKNDSSGEWNARLATRRRIAPPITLQGHSSLWPATTRPDVHVWLGAHGQQDLTHALIHALRGRLRLADAAVPPCSPLPASALRLTLSITDVYDRRMTTEWAISRGLKFCPGAKRLLAQGRSGTQDII